MNEDRHTKGKNAVDSSVIETLNAINPFDNTDILSFLTSVEDHLSQQGQSHAAWVKANIDVVNSSEEAERFAVDGVYQYDGVLPFVLRSSLFVFAYGKLEYSLHTLCKLMQTVHRKECGPEDLRDRGFVRSLNYLKKVIGIELRDDTDNVFKMIRVYGSIRNAITHCSGILKTAERETEGFIRKTDGISLDQDRVIRFEKEFVFNSIEKMQQAWNELSEICSSKEISE